MVNYEDNCKVIVSIFWPKKQLLVLAHLNFEIRQQNSYASSCWRYARKYLHPAHQHFVTFSLSSFAKYYLSLT